MRRGRRVDVDLFDFDDRWHCCRYPPPTTTIFRWFGWASVIGTYDQYGVQAVLVTSSLCAIAAFLSRLLGGGIVDELSQTLERFLSEWGFPIIAALFIFTISGTWAGLVRVQDFNGASVGGMISFYGCCGLRCRGVRRTRWRYLERDGTPATLCRGIPRNPHDGWRAFIRGLFVAASNVGGVRNVAGGAFGCKMGRGCSGLCISMPRLRDLAIVPLDDID